MTAATVSDCCQEATKPHGILLWVPGKTAGLWCSMCGLPCNAIFPPQPTQEEWNQAFEESRDVLEKFMQYAMGVKLCPAHSQRIIQMCEDQLMPHFPKNPGRKDDYVATPKQD